MTENELRQKAIAQAVSWVGRKEADDSHREIIDVYNAIRPLPRGYRLSYTDPWCAGFVSAVGGKAGLTAAILPECSCPYMINLSKNAGRWAEADDYPARPADLIMYDWDDDGVGDNVGVADHVGIIVEETAYYFKVIEGNKSDAVGYRTIAKNSRFIRGFCLPNYAALAADENLADEPTAPAAPAAPIETSGEPFTLELRVLKRGDKGDAVRALQMLLIGRDFSCGGYGVDGDFGPATERSVKNFQSWVGLTVDGVAGKQTFAALMGVSV